MQYRRLGRTEASVSVIGIGTWQMGGLWGKQFTQMEADAIFDVGTELGINFVDTAECYGDHLAETFIGSALKGRREQWVIATKFGHNPGNELGDGNYAADQVQIQLEASLRALQTDYIDVYQIHSARMKFFDNDELWTMLDKQIQAGKVRHLGNSIFLPQAEKQMADSPRFGIHCVQTVYNLISRKAEETVFPQAAEQDMGVIARTPMAMGYLGGRYRRGHTFAGDDVRGILWPQEARDREIGAALEALRDKPDDVNPAAWAIAWCLQNPNVSTVIPGIKSVDQLRGCAGAVDLINNTTAN